MSDIVSPEGILGVSTVDSREVDVRRQNQYCLKIGISVLRSLRSRVIVRTLFLIYVTHVVMTNKPSLISPRRYIGRTMRHTEVTVTTHKDRTKGERYCTEKSRCKCGRKGTKYKGRHRNTRILHTIK